MQLLQQVIRQLSHLNSTPCPCALIAASLMFAQYGFSQQSGPTDPPDEETAAPATAGATPAQTPQQDSAFADGFGFGGGGGFGAIMGIPQSAFPGRNWVAGSSVIVAFSDDGKKVFAYSEQHPRWASQNLDLVPGCVAVPVVGDLAAVRLGHYCYAYSPILGTWDVLKLPAGEAAVPEIGTDSANVHSASQGDYVFKSSWGKWFSAEEIKKGRVAEYLLAQHNSEQAGQPALVKVMVFPLKFAAATDAARLIQQLLAASGGNMSLVADARTNSLLVNADEELVREVESLVKILDAPGEERSQANQFSDRSGDSANLGFNLSIEAPKESVEELRKDFDRLEQRALHKASSLRENSLPPSVGAKSREDQLRDFVQSAFDARQKLQRAELAEFARQLQNIQQSIEMRDRIARPIVDRRVEELLDPNLRWDFGESPQGAPAVGRNVSPVTPHTSREPVAGPAARLGSILGRSEDQTVELSLGTNDRIRVGDRLPVLSNRILQGRIHLSAQGSVEVIEAQRDRSVARIISEQEHCPIEKGDIVSPDQIEPAAVQNTPLLPGTGAYIDAGQRSPGSVVLLANHTSGRLEWLTGPEKWTLLGTESRIHAPFHSQLKFRLSGIKGRGDANVFVTVEIPEANPGTRDVLLPNPIPLSFTSGGSLDPLFNGELVTKVLYLPHDVGVGGGSLFNTVSSFSLPPGVDTVTEAGKLGIVVAVMRFALDARDVTTEALDLNAKGKVLSPELEGTWEWVEMKSTEKSFLSTPLSKSMQDGGRMIIRGNLMSRKSGDGPLSEMRFTCDSAATPRTLTTIRVRNGKEYTNRYIVEVSGDTLRLASSMNGSSEFPKSFDAPRTLIQLYRRVRGTESTTTPVPKSVGDAGDAAVVLPKSPPEQAADLAPGLEPILAGLEQTSAAIRNLSVTTDYVKRQLFLLPFESPIEMTLTTKAVVDSEGRARTETEGQQLNIEPDGKSVRTYRGRWIGVFKDGVARNLTCHEDNPPTASLDGVLTWHGIDPREFTTQFQNKTISQIIRTRGAQIAERTEWDGRPVTIIETTPRGSDEKRRYRFWIDTERKIVVRRAITIRFAEGQPWQEYARIEGREHHEVAPGIWLPTKVKYESLEVTADLTPEKLSWSYEGVNRDWQVNRDLPDDTFELEFPKGVRVNDHRPPARPAAPEAEAQPPAPVQDSQ